MQLRISRLFAALSLSYLGFMTVLTATPALAQSDETWESLRENAFPNREISDGSAFIDLDAPVRAEDAAVVPIAVRVKEAATAPGPLRNLTLIVDENPSPVVATFTYGPAAGTFDAGSPALETRVRINAYSYVRAVVELGDGKLYMVKRFVKASGGCSAPALKDEDQANADIGKMRLKSLPAKQSVAQPGTMAQLMIRHPNYSGLQMNQITRLYIPAHFVREIEIKRDGQLVWRMEGGISISENPNFIFQVSSGASETPVLSVHAVDTDDVVFDRTFTLDDARG